MYFYRNTSSEAESEEAPAIDLVQEVTSTARFYRRLIRTQRAVDLRRRSGLLRYGNSGLPASRQLENFLAVTPALFCILDACGRFLRISDPWVSFSGHAPETLLYHNLLDFLHPDDLRPTLGRLERIQSQGQVARFTNRFRCHDGSYRALEWRVRLDQEFLFASASDVSQQKQTEQDLRKTQELLEQTSRMVRIGAYEADLIHQTLYWSPVTKEIHEVPEDFVPNLETAIQFYREGEHRERIRTLVNRAIETGEPFDTELIIITARGQERWVRALGTTEIEQGVCTRLYGTFQDIDREKRYEEHLAREKEKLQNVIEGTNVGTWEWNVQVGRTVFDERWAAMAGYTLAELEPVSVQTWLDLTHPDDLNVIQHQLRACFRGESAFYECEIRRRHKNGGWVWVLDRGKVFSWTPDGKPLMMYGTQQDIDQRKQAETEVQRLKEQLELAIDGSQNGIWDWDLETNLVFYSKRWKEMLGYAEDELPNTFDTFTALIYPDDRTVVSNAIQQYLSSGSLNYELDLRMLHKDGSVRWITAKGAAVRDAEGRPYRMAGSHTDITERKKAEEELKQLLNLTQLQNERLRNFAHIVSHNLRSHSGNIQSLTDFLFADYPEIESNEAAQLLRQAAANLLETIDHLAEVAILNADQRQELVRLDLATAVSKAISNVAAQARLAQVRIEHQLTGQEQVLGVPAYLHSVLLNLLTNAVRYHRPVAERYVRLSCTSEPPFLVLHVADNGLGIDLQRQGHKLFGMYKTFHGNPDARGIGLFLTKNQVEAMGGRIEVSSEVNQGTTFKIYLKHG